MPWASSESPFNGPHSETWIERLWFEIQALEYDRDNTSSAKEEDEEEPEEEVEEELEEEEEEPEHEAKEELEKEEEEKVKRNNRRKNQSLRNTPMKGRNIQGCLLNQLRGRQLFPWLH